MMVYYYTRHCPICFRTGAMLRELSLDRDISFLSVDVNSNVAGDLIDRYAYFCNRVFGGAYRVPVILYRNNWFVPRVTSTTKTVKSEPEEKIREAVENLKNSLVEALESSPKEYPPTHWDMIFGWSP